MTSHPVFPICTASIAFQTIWPRELARSITFTTSKWAHFYLISTIYRFTLQLILLQGSFRRAVFDACGCGRSVRCGKIENFLSLRKCNRLPQPHASNANRLNEPLDTAFWSLFIEWKLEGFVVCGQRLKHLVAITLSCSYIGHLVNLLLGCTSGHRPTWDKSWPCYEWKTAKLKTYSSFPATKMNGYGVYNIYLL